MDSQVDSDQRLGQPLSISTSAIAAHARQRDDGDPSLEGDPWQVGDDRWRVGGDPWPGDGADAVTADAADLVDELDNEIATLSAHIHAATHRLLVLIARFDRLRGWELAGYSNCARWLAARTGIDLGAAREKVRAARALESLPLTSASMARGELSFSQVRALSRVADRDNEPQLLELARGTTTAQLERMVRAWKHGARKDEAERERERHRARTFSVFPDDDVCTSSRVV